ncbi:hypothetical protein DL93DRAFT_921739 [Clavulina sp. PMI_390]|nr:hypothetical protein DL93DRAFT_921739 [Clavulina sp. PMI_390]
MSSTMALFDGLPDELLADIIYYLAYFRPVFTPSFASDASKQLKLLLVATSVSSRWRCVAIGTSELWTWIVIVDHVLRRGVDVGRSIIRAFLERSSNRSIDIFLTPPSDETPSDSDPFMQLYELVIPHLHRCSSFCCSSLGNGVADRILPLKGHMPKLSKLILIYNLKRGLTTAFEEPLSPPALRTVTILESQLY